MSLSAGPARRLVQRSLFAPLRRLIQSHQHPLHRPRQEYCSAGRSISTTTRLTPPSQSVRRCLATSTTAAPKETSTGNIFLDYAGSIFLGAIGLIVAWLVRSYQNTLRRNLVRDRIEETAHLDPLELDDLRTANTETITLEQFRMIMDQLLLLKQEHEQIMMTYPDFVHKVRSILFIENDNNAAFTVQLGHLLDRVAISALSRHDKTIRDTMPLQFWLTLLSLSLSGCSPSDRIRLLYQMMQAQATNDNGTEPDPVSMDQVVELVGYLQDTCQLVPDAQVVATSRKYPMQDYAVGTPEQLVDRYRWVNKETTGPGSVTHIDLEAMAAILRSKSVCAWGECYHKKKFTV